MARGKEQELDLEHLRETAGLAAICRNRPAASNGVCYGGVAVVWRTGACLFREVPIKNPDGFEILVGAGSIKGHLRRLVVLACYLPPNYDRERGCRAADFVVDLIIRMKRRFKVPYIVTAGDFNQWELDLADLADMEEVPVGLTRGSRSIDKIFTNVPRKVVEAGTLTPLETEEDQSSDHRTAFCTMMLPRQEVF